MTAGRIGVVVMAYGSPRTPDDIGAYYTDIRRGRPPTAEQLADLVRRYDAIGGTSPLTSITEAQCAALQAALDERVPGRYDVRIGLKHSEPRIEQTVTALATAAERVVGLVLAPHFSALSVGEYLGRAGAAAEAAGVEFAGVRSWATEPAYVAFLAAEVRRRLAGLPAGTTVLFTAHSLPRRILELGDPYPDELGATATAVAGAAGLDGTWSVGWQSAGRTPEPWLGPDVLQVIDELGASRRVAGLLVCPCGFVADHLEVRYDLDIEARRAAEAAGLAFDRTASMNDDPTVLGALADRLVALG